MRGDGFAGLLDRRESGDGAPVAARGPVDRDSRSPAAACRRVADANACGRRAVLLRRCSARCAAAVGCGAPMTPKRESDRGRGRFPRRRLLPCRRRRRRSPMRRASAQPAQMSAATCADAAQGMQGAGDQGRNRRRPRKRRSPRRSSTRSSARSPEAAIAAVEESGKGVPKAPSDTNLGIKTRRSRSPDPKLAKGKSGRASRSPDGRRADRRAQGHRQGSARDRDARAGPAARSVGVRAAGRRR